MPKRTIKGTGKKHPLNLRTTKELRKRIEQAAGKSGRSMCAQVEYLVEFGLANFHFLERLHQLETLQEENNSLLKQIVILLDTANAPTVKFGEELREIIKHEIGHG